MTLTLPYQPTFIVADGATRSFNYLFDAVSADFIGVAIKKTDGSVYQPIFAKDLDQQAITLTDSEPTPELGALVCIYRNTPEVQDVAFRTLDGYNARAMENILSKIVAMIQEMRDVADHTTIRTTFPQRDVSIQVITDEDNGATVIIDAENKQLKRGLYFKIANGNLLASEDGQTFIQMPKSANINEFRQVVTDNNHYVFQYRVGNVWYSMDFNAIENTANLAKETSEQAIETANNAISKINDKADKSALELEKTERAESDTNLQSQIDAITSASDVADVVGTYADLEAYDTSKLTDNAIIKVLNDETQDGASTYYRWTI